jgi:hypothetical protein
VIQLSVFDSAGEIVADVFVLSAKQQQEVTARYEARGYTVKVASTQEVPQ